MPYAQSCINALSTVATLTHGCKMSCRLDKRTDADANLEKAKEVSGVISVLLASFEYEAAMRCHASVLSSLEACELHKAKC